MGNKTIIDQELFADLARATAIEINNHYQPRILDGTMREVKLYGIPRGGIPALYAVLAGLGGRYRACNDPDLADAFIDDIYDSGKTHDRYAAKYPGKPFFVLFDKRQDNWKNHWLVMPYEISELGDDDSASDIVTRLLQYIGEDPDREGLKETPKRFLKGWKEWSSGYQIKPEELLKTFDDGAEGVDEMVIVHNIPVVSKCEHHLADIQGIAHVGYVPQGKIVGLSKLARVVDAYSRRLQVQERLTTQIAEVIEKTLQPKGVAVIVRASHACMSSRGVKVHGSVTTTSAMRGVLLNKPEARAEFMALCQAAENMKGC